jgi:sirohydrochlorin ferrochelatase
MLVLLAILLVTAVLSGSVTCLALVLRRVMLPLAVPTAAALFAMGVWAVFGVTQVSGRTDSAIAAAFIGTAGFLGGFTLAATLVPGLTRLKQVRALPAPLADAAAPPAFIVVAGGRPTHYDPRVTTESFDLLSDSEVPVPSDAVRVFSYLSERMRYRSAGPDPSRRVVREVTAAMAEVLRGDGVAWPVYEAWLHGAPRLADAVVTAVEHGSRDIVVVSLDVAETVRRPRTSWQWDRAHPASCEQETFFLQRVRQALVNAGMDESNVRAAWLDWQDPGVTEVVRHLAALGCRRIAVVPATTPADCLETTIDLPAAVEQAGLDPDVRVELLHGWGDDPVVAGVLASTAVRTAREHGLL